MTWEELKEKAKEMGYVLGVIKFQNFEEEFVERDGYTFQKDGCFLCVGIVIAKNRTPDQMLAIMKALQ